MALTHLPSSFRILSFLLNKTQSPPPFRTPMPRRLLAFWLVISIGSPLCCCSQPAPTGPAKAQTHACCASKQGRDKKKHSGGGEQCPHKRNASEPIAETGVSVPASAVQPVELPPVWLDLICGDALRVSLHLSHDATRWREWSSRAESLSFCIRYHALLI
jgi:hypothetical protein